MSLMDAAASGIIANLAKPPDVTAGGDGIAGFFSGYSAGYKQQERRMQGAAGTLNPNDKAPVPSLFGAVVNGFLKAPAERKANADPMFDINKTVAEQTVKMNALHIDEAVKRRDDAVNLKADAASFGQFVQQGLKSGTVTSDEFRGQLLEHLARSPMMLKDPGVQELIKQVQMSQTFLQHKQDIEKSKAAATAAGLVPTEMAVKDSDGVTKYGPKILSPEEQQKQNIYLAGTSASGHPIYHPLSKGLTPEQLTKLGLKPDHTDKDGNVIWKTPMDPKLVAGRIKYMESMNQYMSLKGQALIAHASGQTEAQFLQTMVKSLAANPINAGKTPEQLSEMAKALYRNTKSDPVGLFENLPSGDPFGDETPSGADLEPRNE